MNSRVLGKREVDIPKGGMASTFRVARHSRTLANPANELHLEFSVSPADNVSNRGDFPLTAPRLPVLLINEDMIRTGKDRKSWVGVLGTSPSPTLSQ